MNNVILIGRTTVEPQKNGEYVRFSLAVNRDYKNKNGEYEADFINCVAFGKTADFLNDYIVKGQLICIQGSIKTGSFLKDDGTKVYTTDINIFKVQPLEKKDNDSYYKIDEQEESFEVDDDDLPF